MTPVFSIAAAAAFLAAATPAYAHHAMGGVMPATFTQGLLSGLGHPVIGIDHFVAVIAVGCLAAMHGAWRLLIAAFVLAMIAGAAVHLKGIDVVAVELLIALSITVLGAVMLLAAPMKTPAMLILFAAIGFVHGYALGESIVGAEPAPLYAYFAGLAAVQSAVAASAACIVRFVLDRRPDGLAVRFAGAIIAVIGFAMAVTDLV